MGNANTHERRKSGVPETGLTIENIREKPLNEDVADGSPAVPSVAEKKTDKTPPPSFETTEEDKGEDGVKKSSEKDFRPRAGTAETAGRTKKPSAQCNPGSKGLPTIFKYPGDAKEAYVCGTFSNWDKIPMVRTQKDFVAMVELPIGDHQFKYYVDNEWTSDKNLPTVDNDCGSKNNIISIQQEDFEAFAALDMDSKATNVRHQRGVELEFGQEVPGLSAFEHKAGPPILPPHLLQVGGIITRELS